MTDNDPDARVTSRLRRFDAGDPMERQEDPWSEFRSIDVLGLNWVHQYRHSLGKYSRFFQELENGRLMATKCPTCEMVWMPPRPVCPRDLAVTRWVELPGTGTLAGYTIVHRAPRAVPDLPSPYVLAYAALDGADTLFLHVLDVDGDLSRVQYAIPIHVVFKEGPVDHPIWLMGFEPEQGANSALATDSASNDEESH